MRVCFIVKRLQRLLCRVPLLTVHRQEGQGLVEYALILAMVSVVVIVLLASMARAVRSVYSDVVVSLAA